ncbi:MAG: TspO/MBR family protein [Pseudomonadota bacterium]
MSGNEAGSTRPRPTPHSGHGGPEAPGALISILMLFAFLAVVFICAAAGAYVTSSSVDTWYAGIVKPDLTPANWVFPVVWNLLFFLMGLSAWLVWCAAGGLNEAGLALSLFAGQLMLNFTWSVLFFGLHRPDLATFEIIVLVAAIVLTIRCFWALSRLAALLLAPYLAWCLFATWLTASVWSLNA